jgi:aldehyde dehydrogenase (NAD+)
MMEQWHPLGPVGIITAFNFPTAVWAWNAALAAVCGDSMVWKPSPRTPLCAVAVQRISERVMERHACPGVFNLVIGSDAEVGARLLEDRRLPLISATGSCRLGHIVADTVGQRLGRTILELGGNNAVIVLDDADLDLATRAVVFGAVGTAGQRCTTTRRLIVQKGVAGEMVRRLRQAYASVKIGDPLEPGTLCGPLIGADSVAGFLKALEAARAQGGEVLCGGRKLDRPGWFVEPTLVRAHAGMAIVRQETFAPILYVLEVDTLDEAIERHNDVEQGLSSAIFTRGLLAAERFLSAAGSDCGIANVNCGTSGAEIGGAFGGEKETGGGREAGSDSWKAYMRRQTNVVNFSGELPLAQGVSFDV